MSARSLQVDGLLRELQDTTARAQRLASQYSADELLRKPSEKSWSAADCLEHLNLTNRAYLPRLQSALSGIPGQGPPDDKPYRLNWNAALLKFWLEPPSRLRLPTTAPFQPAIGRDPSAILQDFCSLNSQLIALLESSRNLPLNNATMASPFAENLKYSAYSGFSLVAAHSRRHLWQAERAAAKAA